MIKFDENNMVQDYTIILSYRDHRHIGQILNIDKESVVSKINMNSANEISFTVYKYSNGSEDKEEDRLKEPLWDLITDFKYVYIKELNEYYEIVVETNDDEIVYKSVTGTSACECELSQSNLYNFEINTEADIARDDYINPTVFYNELNPECSLLHRVLYKLPQYSIGHVDGSLMRIQRTFSADDTDVYSFLTQTVAEEIGCLFTFDTVERKINAYDLKNVCLECGYRGEFTGNCPKCGSDAIKYYGNDTTVYIDKENLAESITYSTDTDSVKNCFKLEAGDDNMTAAVINRNPNGSDYIYYFSEETKKDMSPELVSRLDSYDALVESYNEEYGNLMNNIYEYIDKIVYYTSGMMPTIENAPTDAKKELAKLNEANLSPLGLPEVTKSTSVATVNNALKTYAKVFIKSGWFKAEIVDGTFAYVGDEVDGVHHYGTWFGKFKVTNYSDEEDTATHTTDIEIKVTDNYYNFLQQKIDKKISEDDEKEGNIYDVLSIKDLNEFKEALKLYGLNRLKSFSDSIQGCIDIMIESDQANENAELYEELYVPYLNKLDACNKEIDARQKTIDEYNNQLEEAQKRQREIQKQLNFQSYLGEDLYLEFSLYRREQKYTNDNYISDGLENNEIFENAKAFLDAAKEELYKSGEHQHSIEGSLIDLLAIPEFEPLKDSFQVGNFIRIKVDGKIYRLRLVSYQINFGELQTIEVEFSDMTKIRSGTSDLQSVLSKASSMASSYGAITNQVRNSKEQTDLMRNFVQNGLDATAMKIVNNANNQNIVINDAGLLARRKDDFIDTYEDFQIKLLSNGLYFTDNAWRSVKSAFGKYYYTNPLTGKQEIKFGILADSIVGQLIIGEALRLYSNDASAEMSFDDKGLILNTKRDDNGQYKRILDIQKDGESILYIDNEGNLVFAEDQFVDMIEKLERMNVKYLDADKLYANNGTILNFGANFAEIQDLSAPKGTITALTSDTIEAVSGHFTGNVKVDTKLLAAAAQLDALTSTSGNIGELESFKATLENLNATIATITTLNADEITAKKLNATAIKFTELEAAKATIENLINEIGNIKNLTSTKAIVENLSVKGDGSQADIDTLISALGVFTKITGDLGVFKELQADIANLTEAIIPTLSSTNATIENLNATLATIPILNSTTITTDKIIAKSAQIEELDAALGDFEEIKAQLANIQTIMAGNIGTGLLQTIHLTAENTVLSEAFIKDLVAANIAVSDLKAGAISTNKFQIQSDDGGIIINGSTQQFKDNNDKVRLQIGKDAEGNFNFIIFGEDGTTAIYDQNGITKNAVPDGLIVNDMVSDSANISGSKLDINSVVTEINGSTTTINSNKIWVDEDNQSLGASFTQMKQSVNGTIKSVTPYYAKSTSNITAPTDGWSEIPPSRIEGEYIWRKDLYTKTDSSTSWGEPYCVTGDRGENGADGTSVNMKGSYSLSEWETIKEELVSTSANGDAYLVDGNLYVFNGTEFTNCGRIQGNGIKSATVFYQISDSGTDIPTGTWSEKIPEADAGQYLWTKTEIIYDDGTNTTMYGVSSMGKNGRQYELDIVSSNGNIFKNGNINTTLSAVLYEYGEVVTDNYNENCFIWTRLSNDSVSDSKWNASHAGGTKTIEITTADVYGRATFNCDFINPNTRESLL